MKREGHNKNERNNYSKATSEHWTLNDSIYTRIGMYNNQFTVYTVLLSYCLFENEQHYSIKSYNGHIIIWITFTSVLG